MLSSEWSRDVDYALIGYDSATANGTEVIGIDDVYIHPLWDSSNGHYDVMLLVLETPSSIPYATLNTDPSFPDSNVLPQIEIFGIGDATTLQFTSLIHISDQLCFAYLQAGGATGKLYRQFPPGTMCITEYNTRGQCDGDLGGPMVELGETFTEDIVVGVMAR